MERALAAGAIYFGVVFAVGFCLGVARTLLLLPLTGAALAVLIELPIILAVSWWVASRILRRTALSPSGAGVMGAMAFVLLLMAEAAVSVAMGGRTPAEHIALYAQAPHALGLAGQVLFAGFPLVQTLLKRRDMRA